MTSLDEMIATVRGRMVELLNSGQKTRETALVLADLEEELERRARVDERLAGRVNALGQAFPPSRSDAGSLMGPTILDRPLPAGLDDRAGFPRSHRPPSATEAARGVAIAYASHSPTFYRALIERLRPGEKFRLETQFGAFEMTRGEFETALPSMVRSNSYQQGTDGAPGAARYVTGRVPRTIEQYRV
jgi:hypothetical protein